MENISSNKKSQKLLKTQNFQMPLKSKKCVFKFTKGLQKC